MVVVVTPCQIWGDIHFKSEKSSYTNLRYTIQREFLSLTVVRFKFTGLNRNWEFYSVWISDIGLNMRTTLLSELIHQHPTRQSKTRSYLSPCLCFIRYYCPNFGTGPTSIKGTGVNSNVREWIKTFYTYESLIIPDLPF